MYVSLFGKNLRKVTAELLISAIIVSLIEELALIYFGFLNVNGTIDFLVITAILAIIELVLMFIIEESLIAAKHHVRRRINNRRSLRRHSR